MAGAASEPAATTAPPPTAAERRNLRRCMCFTPRNVSCFAKTSTQRNQPATRNGAWQRAGTKKQPRRSGAFHRNDRRSSELVGGGLARHEIVEGVFGDPEPQDLVLA